MWIGLDNLVSLNRAGYTKVVNYLQTNTGRYQIVYKNFYMRDETLGYSFTLELDSFAILEGPGFNLTDCFQTAYGLPFSTWDHQTVPGDNCAVKAGNVGWWFPPGCDLVCNPLGLNPAQQPANDDKSLYVGGVEPGALVQMLVYFESSV